MDKNNGFKSAKFTTPTMSRLNGRTLLVAGDEDGEHAVYESIN
jgi:hypothetical protein